MKALTKLLSLAIILSLFLCMVGCDSTLDVETNEVDSIFDTEYDNNISEDQNETDVPSITETPAEDTSDKQTSTNKPAPDPTKAPTPKPTKEPTPKPTKKTTPIPTKAPTPRPTEKPTASDAMVWIPTKGGKRYHSKSTCSGMKDPIQVTKSKAVSQGFTACGRCY